MRMKTASYYAKITELFENRPSGNASLPDYLFLSSLRDMGTLGDFRPGNGIVAQALLSVSRRSASLYRPQGALGFGPPKPLAWDRSLPPPVADEGRRSVGNRKECRLRHDYASFPGPQTPSSLRAYSSFLSENSITSQKAGAALRPESGSRCIRLIWPYCAALAASIRPLT